MTSGFADSTMMTVFSSTTLVSTFCCSVDSSAPLSWAFLRIRWTASMTSSCWARKALPRSVVHWMSSTSRFTTSGTAAIDWMLGSQGCLATASASALSFESGFFVEPLLELDELERVGRGDERLGQQRVGVEGDRRDQRVELLRRELGCGLLGCAGRRRGRLYPSLQLRQRRLLLCEDHAGGSHQQDRAADRRDA